MPKKSTAVTVPRNTLAWLISKDNAPVRWLSMRDFLNKQDSNKELRLAKSLINGYKPIQIILKHWEDAFGDFKNKTLTRPYKGGLWSLIFLGTCFANRSDDRITASVEQVMLLKNTDSEYDFFNITMTAHIYRALWNLGFQDKTIIADIDRLAKSIVASGGVDKKKDLAVPAALHSPAALLTLTEIPRNKQTPAIKKAIMLLTAFITDTALPKIMKSLNSNKGILPLKGKNTAARFGFPWVDTADVLMIVYACLKANAADSPVIQSSIDYILSKADNYLRWSMENNHSEKMWQPFEQRSAASRWITYFALRIIKKYRGIVFG